MADAGQRPKMRNGTVPSMRPGDGVLPDGAEEPKGAYIRYAEPKGQCALPVEAFFRSSSPPQMLDAA